MTKKILLFILCFLSITTYADCPQFNVKGNREIEKVGISPNGKPIYQVVTQYDMGFGHIQYLSIVTTDTNSLPPNITFCMDGKHDVLYFNSSTAITQKEIDNRGIITILPFLDASIKAKTSLKGQSLLIDIKHYDISGRSDIYRYLTYSWTRSSKKYTLIDEKEVSNVTLELLELQNNIESQDTKQLLLLLKEFNYGGGYGSRLYRFPKEFSKDLWTLFHKKSLSLYKSGNEIEAAQLIHDLLKVVMVQIPEDLEDEYRDKGQYYNFGIDALHENRKLVPQISDCAFFLQQANLNLNEAIFLFRYIVKISPHRVVTYLNLGDALWKNSEKGKAIIEYEKYISLMQSYKSRSKIPNYVLKRTKK